MVKSRSAASLAPSAIDSASFQRDFFARLGDSQQFQQLFEHLPGVYFFVKDRQSRMVCASRPFWRHLGVESEDQIVGRTDDEFFPRHAADHFRRDDEWVLSTGQSLIGRVELWYTEQRVLDWFVTNKHPLRDPSGGVIGLMGIVRSYEGQRQSMQPMSLIQTTVDYVRERHQTRLTVEELASRAELSPRQLQRKFRDVFGLSAREFLVKTRLQAASDALLRTDLSLAQIAVDFGFCDQSAFTQAFRKHLGLTPRQFRLRYSAPGLGPTSTIG